MVLFICVFGVLCLFVEYVTCFWLVFIAYCVVSLICFVMVVE